MQSPHGIAAQSFSQLARDFCSWCEGASLGDAPEEAAASWLAKLYAAGLALPEVESDNSDGLPILPSDIEELARRNLGHFSGMYYREYFDPDPSLTDESVMGDIGDDLLDTYQDIRRGLIIFDANSPLEALWHWEFLHRVHWGRHAVGAMFALHCLFVSKSDD
jgi:hypothetical protein